jgi:hypothetical protein
MYLSFRARTTIWLVRSQIAGVFILFFSLINQQILEKNKTGIP